MKILFGVMLTILNVQLKKSRKSNLTILLSLIYLSQFFDQP